MERHTPLKDPSYFGKLFSPFPNFSNTDVRPAYFDAQQQVWHVFRYTEVQRILSDYKLFSASRDRTFPTIEQLEDPVHTSMISQDPPRHTRLRKLVSHAFSQKMVARLAAKTREIVEDILIKIKGQGHMDLVADLAHPLPSTIIAELLGVPFEDHLQFRHWAFDYMSFMTPESAIAANNLIAYFEKLVETRRQNPGEDLISDLLAAEVDGERLSSRELVGTCIFLIVAGQGPGGVLANIILALDTFPEIQTKLRTNPELIPGAIEEVIRYFTPVISTPPHLVFAETVIDGQTIPEGAWVIPWLSAANRDPSQFVNPEEFDILRSPNRHLSFGFGVHFCLGAPLARLETKIALEAILHHLHDIHIDHSTPLERIESPILFSVKHAPIIFTPA